MEEKINKIFNEYDESEALPSFLSESDLKKASNKLAEIEKKEASNEGIESTNSSEIADKLRCFSKILSRVQANLNKVFNGVILKTTMTSGSSTSEISVLKSEGLSNNKVIRMNFNISKICKYPALNLYSIIYAKAYEQAVRLKMAKNEQAEGALKPKTLTNAEKIVEGKDKPDILLRAKAIFVIEQYTKSFLSKYYDQAPNMFDNIAKSIAENVTENLDTAQLQKFIEDNFDKKKIDKIAIDLTEKLEIKKPTPKSTINEIDEARLSKVNEKATMAIKFGLAGVNYSNAKALNFMQQSEALTSVEMRAKFNDLVSGGLNKQNMDYVQAFCTKFARTFMEAQKLPPISVQIFYDVNLKEYGGYVDSGNSHYIRLNLAYIDSFTELSATLSHELTHAVDSSINKLQGKAQNGLGLVGGVSENISGSGLAENSEEFKFLKEIQNLCYLVNPNERHARVGELSGLLMMKEFGKDNPQILSQLDKSIDNFVKYQQRTINALDSLKTRVPQIKAQFDSFVKNGTISEGTRAYDLIKERIEFLSSVKNDSKQEQMSIEFATGKTFGKNNENIMQGKEQSKVNEDELGVQLGG